MNGRGRCGGQVVSELAFYPYNPSSKPAEAYSFYVNFVFVNIENKQKEAGLFGSFKQEIRMEGLLKN